MPVLPVDALGDAATRLLCALGLVGTFATEIAIARARATGVGLVGVCHCNHVGALADYTERVAECGMLGVMVANTAAIVAPAAREDRSDPLLGKHRIARKSLPGVDSGSMRRFSRGCATISLEM